MTPKNSMSKPLKPDDGSGLIRLTFVDDGESSRVTGTHVEDGINVVNYKDNKGNQHYSTIKEVKQWIEKTKLTQAANLIRPTRKSYINNLASAMHDRIRTYDVKLPRGTQSKPTSYRKAGNSEQTQWFHTEDKERDGILEFETWKRLPQDAITPAMRKKALRAHHLYDIKRDMSAKNRVVVNENKQHEDTYTDTTSPISSQLQLRLFFFITAYRQYEMVQRDLTNAYLRELGPQGCTR
jgi:hypothetical protein